MSTQDDYVDTEEEMVNENSSQETSCAVSYADNDETDHEIEHASSDGGADADNERSDNEEVDRGSADASILHAAVQCQCNRGC